MDKEKKNPHDEIILDDVAAVAYDDDVAAERDDELSLKIKKLRDKLKECEKERMEYLSGWQRAKADFINSRREDGVWKKEYMLFANEGLIGELLPVMDSFALAFSNKEAWEKTDKNWRIGVEYIYSQLSAALGEHGLVMFGAKSEIFDPSKHTALETIETDDLDKDGLIENVLQQGYILNGKIIRPAKVNVYKYSKQSIIDN
ncbi:MAG: nucleotide exchange factor GrpE [Patescibacteria group bacterium]